MIDVIKQGSSFLFFLATGIASRYVYSYRYSKQSKAQTKEERKKTTSFDRLARPTENQK
jgi:hypothetical protein